MSAALPLQPEEKIPFLRLPLALADALFDVSANAAHIVQYVARHTIGWQNAEVTLSADEFLHGRRKAGGGRYDLGLQKMRSKTTALKAANEAKDAGLLQISEVLGPRGVRTYSIPEKFLCPKNGRLTIVPDEKDVSPATTVQNMDVSVHLMDGSIQNMDSDRPIFDTVKSRQGRQEEARRVAIDTSIDTLIDNNIDTSLAPLARASSEAQVEVEEVRYPLQGHKAIAQAQEPISISPTRAQLEIDLDRARNDLRNAKQHGGTSKRIKDLERAINDIHAQIAALRDLSDSQEQEASPSTALYEEKPQDEKPALRIVPRLKVHQQQYIEWQAELANKRQALEDWKRAVVESEEEWRTCPTTSKRRELHLEYLACQDEVRRLEHSIAKAEIFLQLIEDGADPQDAAKEAKERAGLQPLHDDHSNDPEQPALPEMEAEPVQEPAKAESLFAVIARDWFGLESTKNLNDSSKRTIGKMEKEFKQCQCPPEAASIAIKKFKRERPSGNPWEFLSKLPNYVSYAMGVL